VQPYQESNEIPYISIRPPARTAPAANACGFLLVS
jgi:hypothetical protein